MTTTIEANVLSASYPVVMGVLAFLFLHEKVKLQRWISIAVGVLGTYIVAVGFGLPKLDSSNSIGNLIFLGGLILECMALTMATRIILRSSGLGTLVFEATGAAIGSVLYSFLFPSFFSLSVKSFGWPQIAMMAYLVLIGGIFAFGVWYVFVEKAPVSLMMLSTLIQPPLAALLGFCILKEEIGFKTLVGTLIIAVSLVIAAFDRHSKLIPPSPQELEPI